MAITTNRRIVRLQIWVEYQFGDADRTRGARVKIPIQGVTDLLRLPASLPPTAPDLADGVPRGLCIEVTWEGGHSAYLEIGQLGGAFGSLNLVIDEGQSSR